MKLKGSEGVEDGEATDLKRSEARREEMNATSWKRECSNAEREREEKKKREKREMRKLKWRGITEAKEGGVETNINRTDKSQTQGRQTEMGKN